MAKDVRSISAHEPIYNKRIQPVTTYRTHVKQFCPENDYYDKETLYNQIRSLKEELNNFKNENTKLKTKLQLCQRDLISYEKVCDNYSKKYTQSNVPSLRNPDKLIIEVKKLNKELALQISEKEQIIEQYKRSQKVTKIQELDAENKYLKDETIRLRELILQQEDQYQEIKTQLLKTNNLRSNITKTNQTMQKCTQENGELRKKNQQLEDVIKELKNEKARLTTKVTQLEDSIHKLNIKIKHLDSEIVVLKKVSTTSFKKPATDSSTQQLNCKYQEELQYKLILRGITYQQFATMIVELKQQADLLKKVINKEDLFHILEVEPFTMSQSRIKEIVSVFHSSGHRLADQFLSCVGKYKTFYDFVDFSLEDAEQLVARNLKEHYKKGQLYLLNLKTRIFKMDDVKNFLNFMQFQWSEPVELYYLLNLFEKAGQKFEFQIDQILDPFPTILHEASRIVEESEEDFFEQDSYQSERNEIENENENQDENENEDEDVTDLG